MCQQVRNSLTIIMTANCPILYSKTSISIPLIRECVRSKIPRISTPNVNKYGERASPCRQPLSMLNGFERCPFCKMYAFAIV